MAPVSPRAQWDPAQYARHSGDRARPLRDLIARVPALPDAPRIADLGCGPGRPSLLLAERWPDARVTGYDNSDAMLAEAATVAGPLPGGAGSLAFAHADLATWRPAEPFDLILSNAALQWVPGHVSAFPAWVAGLAPGGVLAFQVPGNFAAPSHVLMRELCASPRWRDRLGGVLRHPDAVLTPEGYFDALADLGSAVDVWETTYLHLLPGDDPVLDWLLGTGLRPVLTALDGDPGAREAFVDELRGALRAAYPRGPHGTLFPFRRVFAVATSAGRR
ncbi:trans-aconitate 2-methyltransferase [Streptomyces radicis]|uniref:Trans-aconitate 2-methyltransferase n=1 Tax=Streptomyces radicis TaxID=1750517 RepID=A0A3A9W700_9ACTN|nr:trans-aconitate 2-methyltransferase [Streptomyces radicis]RKN08650.1 trans-aconitate 2-methyltransferase [Streptomyces radicis]RKN21808.1 trans-aconitate 2-methyltransferase [Streptomyces radicis]